MWELDSIIVVAADISLGSLSSFRTLKGAVTFTIHYLPITIH
jgi:hypothetical protein